MKINFQDGEKRKNTRLAETLGEIFIQRWDRYAIQLKDGSYLAIRKPITSRHLTQHLEGSITLGTYILRPDNTAGLMVLDTDAPNGLDNLKGLAAELEKEGIASYLETSRRGGHLWFFFAKNYEAKKVRAFGRGIIGRSRLTGIELFPKQNMLLTGPGSLVRLPFGKHRVTNKRYPFIFPSGKLLSQTGAEQIGMLSAHQNVSEGLFDAFAELGAKEEKPPVLKADKRIHAFSKIERIKHAVDLVDFIGAYIELKPVASGAVGICPFHNDTRPSLGVNRAGSYWHCFAGCGSGSIIDFWMRYKGVNFSQAVNELGSLLGVE